MSKLQCVTEYTRKKLFCSVLKVKDFSVKISNGIKFEEFSKRNGKFISVSYEFKEVDWGTVRLTACSIFDGARSKRYC